MTPSRFAHAIVLAASLPFLVSSLVATQTQRSKGQWLIEDVRGKWEVRESPRRTHVMSKFEVLTSENKIRCLALPCTLTYATADGVAKRFPLPGQPRAWLNQWMAVPSPIGSPAGPRAAGLQEIVAKIGSRGGRQKDSPICSGKLPLLAPTCGELIDPGDFKLLWSPRGFEAAKTLTLLVGSADSSERKRWNDIQADAGTYGSRTLQEYLLGLALPDRATDVTIRLMRTESLDAIRVVRLPSTADYAEYQRKVAGMAKLPPLSRQLMVLEHYLTIGMWSKAAEIAQQLLRDAPDSLEIDKYAIVAFCRSDFADEIARLRTTLKDAGVSGFCESDGVP